MRRRLVREAKKHAIALRQSCERLGKKKLGRTLGKWLKRRAASEPSIGHMKSDHRMSRNHYQGELGDAINALLSAARFNLRLLLAFFLRWILQAFSALIFAGRKSYPTKYAFHRP